MPLRIIAIVVSSRFPNRATIKFSNNSFLPLGLVAIRQLCLNKNQQISPQKLQEIIHASLGFLLKNYALRQIAISAKTEKMLQQKLQSFLHQTLKKYRLSSHPDYQTVIQETLSYIKKRGLLRPQELIDYVLRKHQNKSFFYIQQLLKQKGVDPLLIPTPPPHQEAEKIKRLLAKKHVQKKDFIDHKTKMKIYASLAGKGFSYSDIKAAIDDSTNLS